MIRSTPGRSEPTLSEVEKQWREKGWSADYDAAEGGQITCREHGVTLPVAEFTVDRVRRFEGATNPGDEAILLAMGHGDCKGTLSLPFGPAAPPWEAEVLWQITSKGLPQA